MCDGRLDAPRFTAPVLGGRYLATYRDCLRCGTLQVLDPSWLTEAYADKVGLNLRNVDSGRWLRNFSVFLYLVALRSAELFPADARLLDFGGDEGILAQLLIDSGWDAWTHDPNVQFPALATHRTLDAATIGESSVDVITCLEVFEHLLDPVETGTHLRRWLRSSGTLVISTGLYDSGVHGRDWDYLSTEAGQHITFWSRHGLRMFAERFGFASIGYWPGADGFLVVMSPLGDKQLRQRLDTAGALLQETGFRARATAAFDLRETGFVVDQPRPQVDRAQSRRWPLPWRHRGS